MYYLFFSLQYSTDHIVSFSMGFNQLLVFTRRQCYAYSLPDIKVLFTIDMKERVNFVVMSVINFVVVGPQEVIIYSNEGRSHASPKFQGILPDKISKDTISISPDTLAIVDQSDTRVSIIFWHRQTYLPFDFLLNNNYLVLYFLPPQCCRLLGC